MGPVGVIDGSWVLGLGSALGRLVRSCIILVNRSSVGDGTGATAGSMTALDALGALRVLVIEWSRIFPMGLYSRDQKSAQNQAEIRFKIRFTKNRL